MSLSIGALKQFSNFGQFFDKISTLLIVNHHRPVCWRCPLAGGEIVWTMVVVSLAQPVETLELTMGSLLDPWLQCHKASKWCRFKTLFLLCNGPGDQPRSPPDGPSMGLHVTQCKLGTPTPRRTAWLHISGCTQLTLMRFCWDFVVC